MTTPSFIGRRPAVAITLRLGALLGTTYLLVATSPPYSPPAICLHLAERVTFDVAGTCGPPGTITAVTEEDECGISVVGAGAVGLPAGGSFDVSDHENDTGLLRTPWTLSGFLTPARPDGGASDLADVNSEVGPASDAGGDDAADGGADGGASDAGRVSDGGPSLTEVPVPGARAPGLGETRECTVTLGPMGPTSLVCRPARQNTTSRPDCTALLTRK